MAMIVFHLFMGIVLTCRQSVMEVARKRLQPHVDTE